MLEEIRSHDLAVASADLSMIPQTTLQLAGKPAQQMVRLMESLEDHDDVQKVFANFDIEDAELEAAAS